MPKLHPPLLHLGISNLDSYTKVNPPLLHLGISNLDFYTKVTSSLVAFAFIALSV